MVAFLKDRRVARILRYHHLKTIEKISIFQKGILFEQRRYLGFLMRIYLWNELRYDMIKAKDFQCLTAYSSP